MLPNLPILVTRYLTNFTTHCVFVSQPDTALMHMDDHETWRTRKVDYGMSLVHWINLLLNNSTCINVKRNLLNT